MPCFVFARKKLLIFFKKRKPSMKKKWPRRERVRSNTVQIRFIRYLKYPQLGSKVSTFPEFEFFQIFRWFHRSEKQQCLWKLGKDFHDFNSFLPVFPPKLCQHLRARQASSSSQSHPHLNILAEDRSYSHMNSPAC